MRAAALPGLAAHFILGCAFHLHPVAVKRLHVLHIPISAAIDPHRLRQNPGLDPSIERLCDDPVPFTKRARREHLVRKVRFGHWRAVPPLAGIVRNHARLSCRCPPGAVLYPWISQRKSNHDFVITEVTHHNFVINCVSIAGSFPLRKTGPVGFWLAEVCNRAPPCARGTGGIIARQQRWQETVQ
jgi:hypothetical protein